MTVQIFEFINLHNHFKLFFLLYCLNLLLLKLILFLPLIIGYQ